MALIMALNLIILVLVSKSLTRKSTATKTNQMSNVTKIRIFVACSTLMGTTWIIGLFAIKELTFPFQLIFCVLNSLQGFFIFVFYCVRAPDVRREWMKCFGKGDEARSSTGAVMYKARTMDSTGVTLGTLHSQGGKLWRRVIGCTVFVKMVFTSGWMWNKICEADLQNKNFDLSVKG